MILFSPSLCNGRPEKDHAAQLRSFHELLTSHPEYRTSRKDSVKLVLVGGCRNSDDAARVDGLRRLAKDLEIDVSHDIRPILAPC
jgi:alpha-1,2-mannosyltransferase